ncbi:MAG: DUF4838 domain-containing protein [Candidatus Brocadiia bacterium]
MPAKSRLGAFAVAVWLAALGGCRAPGPADLTPVNPRRPADHAPVVLAEGGEARGSIAVMVPRDEMSRTLKAAVGDLQEHIELATGAKLPVVYGEADGAVVVVGDCPLAAAHGLDGSRMPVEGFAVKTTPGAVLIVGRDGELAPRTRSDGTAWGIYDFLERVVGVRWYFPGEAGRDVPRRERLAVEPLWYEDAPVFRKRHIWPSGGRSVTRWTGVHHRRMRSADSWPVRLQVHSPTGWPALYGESRPECFQLRADGTRNFQMLCYGHPRTLETYLETIEAWYARGDGRAWGGKPPVGENITVSPNDMAIACHCPYCRALWQPDAGPYGTASKVVGTFVARLAREVQRRWPDKTVIYLPYVNYTEPPQGLSFPDNVEVQLCGMPGLALYKEPAIAASEQQNIDGWVRLTGRKIQNWHYSCWPANQTRAAYQYPHVVQRHYRRNRGKTVGSFINGSRDHWDRQGLSLYVWMRCLWNPQVDVPAVLDAYCRRMFGPAAGTMRTLVQMQIDGWEQSRWPAPHRPSPRNVYELSYPREDVRRMQALLARARREAEGQPLVQKRLDYLAGPLEDFFAESEAYAEGTGRTALVVRKAGQAPAIDGRLDEPAWERAEAVSFVRALDKEQPQPRFPTTLKALWTPDGVVFGFRMAEPKPQALARDIQGRDAAMAWWNDNVEVFLDVTAQRTDYYQLIINPNAAVYDAHGRDAEWTCRGLRAAAHVGPDHWSLEAFVPLDAFPDALRPAPGVEWYGNFTRHRVADKKPREYQRLNTTYAGPSNNMMAFGPIRFME